VKPLSTNFEKSWTQTIRGICMGLMQQGREVNEAEINNYGLNEYRTTFSAMYSLSITHCNWVESCA